MGKCQYQLNTLNMNENATPFFPQIFWYAHGSILSATKRCTCILNNNRKIAKVDIISVADVSTVLKGFNVSDKCEWMDFTQQISAFDVLRVNTHFTAVGNILLYVSSSVHNHVCASQKTFNYRKIIRWFKLVWLVSVSWFAFIISFTQNSNYGNIETFDQLKRWRPYFFTFYSSHFRDFPTLKTKKWFRKNKILNTK